jgi:hypothetical protein
VSWSPREGSRLSARADMDIPFPSA